MKQKLWMVWMLMLFVGANITMAQTAQDIINKLKAKYDGGGAIKALFTQTMTQGSKSRNMSGTIVMQKSKYRVETGDQTLVTDGKTTWAYSKQQKKVLVDNYQADENTFSPDIFFAKQAQRFNIQKLADQKVNGTDAYQLKFNPKSSGMMMKETILWVRKSDAMPIKVSILDQNNTRILLTLTNLQQNPPINNSTFSFSAPKGVQVVDLR